MYAASDLFGEIVGHVCTFAQKLHNLGSLADHILGLTGKLLNGLDHPVDILDLSG